MGTRWHLFVSGLFSYFRAQFSLHCRHYLTHHAINFFVGQCFFAIQKVKLTASDFLSFPNLSLSNTSNN